MYNIPSQVFFKNISVLYNVFQAIGKQISNTKNETIQMEKVSYKIC